MYELVCMVWIGGIIDWNVWIGRIICIIVDWNVIIGWINVWIGMNW